MAFKFVILAAFVACANAGVISSPAISYSAGPALHASYAAPVAHAAYAAPVAHAAYAAPVAHAAYAAPVAHAAYAAPVAHAAYAAPAAVVAKTVDDEYDPNPQYSYSYDVHDSITGDAKSQQETRNGDQVQGSYSLLEADGTRRIVEYTADAHNGFNAVVHKEPAAVAVKAVAAAPVVAKAVHAAPVAYAAPVAHAGHYDHEYY